MSKRNNLINYLPYWDIYQNTMFLRDGRIGVAMEVTYKPYRMMSFEDIEAASAAVGLIIRQVLPENAVLRCYVEATQGTAYLPDAYLQSVEAVGGPLSELHRSRIKELEYRVALGMVRSWRIVFTIVFRPTVSSRSGYTEAQLTQAVNEGRGLVESVTTIMRRIDANVRQLTGEEIISWIFSFLNPGLDVSQMPSEGSLRERVALSEINSRHSWLSIIGETWWITAVSLFDGPSYTSPLLLDQLLDIDGEFRFIVEVVVPDQMVISQQLNLTRVRLKQVAEDLGKRADPELVEGANAIEIGLRQRARTGERICRTALTVLIYARSFNQIVDNAQKVRSALSSLSGARVARAHAFMTDHLLRTIPFSQDLLFYNWKYLDMNAAMLFPVRSPWQGVQNARAFYLTREGSMVGIDSFDPRVAAHNGLVVGGGGSGKTLFMQGYLVSFLLYGGFLAIIDKGDGYVPLMQMLGGQIIRLQAGSDIAINPFDLPPGQVEPDEPKKQFLLAVLRSMLTPSEGGGGSWSVMEESLLLAAIERVYMANTVDEVVDGKIVRRLKTFTLSDFREILLKLEEAYGLSLGSEERAAARKMALSLTAWTGNTIFGRLVDRPTNIDLSSNLVYFETTGITSSAALLPVGILLITDLIWRRVQQDPSQRKLIIFDEVWALFKSKEASAFIEELYRRVRRYNAGAISISQDMQSFREGYARGIIDSTYYFFLMSATGQETIIQELLGLSDRTIETYRHLTKQREVLFLMRSERNIEGDVLRYYPSTFELAAFSTYPADQAERNRLAQEYGDIGQAISIMATKRLVRQL